MSKPVMIVRVAFSKDVTHTIRENCTKIRETVVEQLPDYNILVIPYVDDEVDPKNAISFDAFYPQDFDTKNLEKIQQEIKTKIDTLKIN